MSRHEWQGDQMGPLELFSLAAILGAFLGGLFGVFDMFYHGRDLPPGDVLVAIGFCAVPAIVITMLMTVLLWIGARVLRTSPRRQQWVGLLSGAVVVGLVAVVVLVGTKHCRDWVGVLLVLASLPAAALTYRVATRIRTLAEPARAVCWTLAAIQGLVIASCGMAAVQAWGLSEIAGLLAPIGALGVFCWATSGARSRPLRTGLVLGASLPITGSAFAVLGHPSLQPAARSRGHRMAQSPNVVWIVLDTTRRDHLGCYGHPGQLTPELDRLANESAVYEDAISPSPWTVPAHASMFTGLHPVTHGCSREHHLWLDDDFVTVAEMLRSEGYRTLALYSNWWLGSTNQLQGFDTAVPLGKPYFFLALRELSMAVGFPERWADKGGSQACEELTKWLAQNHDSDSPFFLFVNLVEPHSRYLPPRAERSAHLPQDIGYAKAASFALHFNTVTAHATETNDPYTKRVIGNLYMSSIQYQDRLVGELLSLLREYTDSDNTLLIVTSDHGENLGDGGRWGHSHAINDVLIHVPLIIRYPKRFTPGSRISGLCQLVDLVPTVYDVIGQPLPVPSLPGRSLVPDRFVGRKEAFAQVAPNHDHFSEIEATLGWKVGIARFNVHRRVIRTKEYKYVWISDGRRQLFCLSGDPAETVNLVDREPKLAAELDQRLSRWWTAQPTYTAERESTNAERVKEDTIEKLKSLGYLGE